MPEAGAILQVDQAASIAGSVYVLAAIVKKRLDLDASLFSLCYRFSRVTLFEKMPLHQALTLGGTKSDNLATSNQLNLCAL
ncbi:MAG TPA: hypothetical protein HPP50_00340 [Rhodospirillaceae bacterium]|nr:hypothetical protein [Rhodospirillaceae bacterium]